MHLGFDAAPAAVSTPFPPECLAQIFRCAERVVLGDRTGGAWLPRPGISKRRNDCGGTAFSDSITASTRVVCPICVLVANLKIAQELVEKLRSHRSIPGIASGDLDHSDFQRMFVDTNVDLAPDASFRAAMLASIPFAFPFYLDAGAIDQEVQRTLRAEIRNVDRTRPLTSA